MTGHEIIERCGPYLRKLANRAAQMFGEDADDWHQELALEVLRFAHTHDPARGAVTTWVHLRWRRLVALRMRPPPKKRAGRCVPLPEYDSDGAAVAMLDPRAVDPADQVAEGEDRDRARSMLNDLEPRRRVAVSMWFGLSGPPKKLKEIGDALGVSKERARQLIVAGVAELAREIQSAA